MSLFSKVNQKTAKVTIVKYEKADILISCSDNLRRYNIQNDEKTPQSLFAESY